jgi:hypothetical protein
VLVVFVSRMSAGAMLVSEFAQNVLRNFAWVFVAGVLRHRSGRS